MLKLITKSFIKSESKRGSQHDRTQTWISGFDFNRIGSAGDMVNQNILACFEIWLIKGGFKGKRTQTSVQYFNAKQRLEMDYTGRMNKPMKQRYEIFLKQYLNNGKEFLESLKVA